LIFFHRYIRIIIKMAHLEFSISNMFFPKSCKNPSRKPFLSNKYFQKAITVPDGTINGIRSRIRRIRPLLCFFKTSTRSKAIAIPSGIAIPQKIPVLRSAERNNSFSNNSLKFLRPTHSLFIMLSITAKYKDRRNGTM
ncbi:hypothetical protein, partial [Fusicatenibacter saccharivorans]|uniref:hypothetical protein n=1 Tax=Fusicatenibacter saccharivorans TaxID=1150298 RepID=UPI0034A1A9F5